MTYPLCRRVVYRPHKLIELAPPSRADAAFFMSYVRGEDRGQVSLLPAAIEDYVAADAPVRVIDVFVDGLDMIGLGDRWGLPGC